MGKEQDIRTYHIIQQNGDEFEIDVPGDHKVTFGPLKPGDRFQGEIALRIYESDTKQRIVIRDVKSFRDKSYPMRRKIESVSSRKTSFSDGKGNVEGNFSSDVQEEWEEV